jgi:predicted nucleic acid-binding protein
MAMKYRVKDVAVITSIEHWDLGLGESQVIAHTMFGSRWAVLDDRAARRCAAAHNVPVIGSLGIVLRGKDRGLIEHARPLMEELVNVGMFVEEAFLVRVLESVGE